MIVKIRGIVRDISTIRKYENSVAIHMNLIEPVNRNYGSSEAKETIFPITAFNNHMQNIDDIREGDYVEVACTLYSKAYNNGNFSGYNLRLKLIKLRKI